jgi:hypothetical protein
MKHFPSGAPLPAPGVGSAQRSKATTPTPEPSHRGLARTNLHNLIRLSRAPRRRRCPAAAHLAPTFV